MFILQQLKDYIKLKSYSPRGYIFLFILCDFAPHNKTDR
nr:MAG TPA: hypothetical protein [Caudoviricetes sp.]